MGNEEKPYKCPGYVDNPRRPGQLQSLRLPEGFAQCTADLGGMS